MGKSENTTPINFMSFKSFDFSIKIHNKGSPNNSRMVKKRTFNMHEIQMVLRILI